MSSTVGRGCLRDSRRESSRLSQVSTLRAFGVAVIAARAVRALGRGRRSSRRFANGSSRREIDRHDVALTDVLRKVGHHVVHLVPHDRDACAVVLELMAQLTRRVERVVLDHDRAESQHGVERHDVLGAVREHDRDSVPGRDAESAKTLRGTRDLDAELVIFGLRAEELQSHGRAVGRRRRCRTCRPENRRAPRSLGERRPHTTSAMADFRTGSPGAP